LAWAWDGEPFAPAAKAFGLTLALSISLFFFGTVPPRLYAAVTCDNLSLGYYSLAAIGGGLLLFAAAFASRASRVLSFRFLPGSAAPCWPRPSSSRRSACTIRWLISIRC
jgi:hypothetical protein